jgi:hypothetical protein
MYLTKQKHHTTGTPPSLYYSNQPKAASKLDSIISHNQPLLEPQQEQEKNKSRIIKA